MEKIILHSDLNNFYASVECLYNPEIRGKPVAVVGDPELRHGIVLAKNYEAKRYNVQTGDPLWMAQQKCREIVFVPPHYDRYIRYSNMAREIYEEYTDQVEAFGLDECWLDVTGSTHLFGSGVEIARQLRERIKFELGVTASVGVSFNKIFAKLGSDLKKPDATTEIPFDGFQKKVWPLPVKELLYVGRATQNKLRSIGITTIGHLATTDVKILERKFGKIGRMLWMFANGLDNSPVSNIGAKSMIKSIGNSTTTPRDLITDTDVKITLYALCESVAERLRDHGFRCKTVQITLRNNELYSFERQLKLPVPTCTAQDIFEAAFKLYKRNHDKSNPLRSLAVRACDLIYQENIQLSLFPDRIAQQRQEDLEDTIDQIRNRFGHFAVQRGIMLTDPILSNIDPKGEHIIHPVGFLG